MRKFFSIRSFVLCLLLSLIAVMVSACADDSEGDTTNNYYSDSYSTGAAVNDVMISTDVTLKNVKAIVQSSGSWKLWRCDTAESCNTGVTPVAAATGAGVFDVESNVTTRKYYLFENEHGRAMVADRFLPLERLANARDLGGIVGAGGRQIKYGKIVRSEAMGNLIVDVVDGAPVVVTPTPTFDDNFLSGMGAKYVVDFRSASEKTQIPAHAPTSVPQGNLIEMPISPLLAAPSSYTDAMYLEMYPTVFLNPATGAQAAYKRLFQALMADDGLVIYHCTSGKDRAGMASFLILTALGASEAAAYEDYMATSKVAGGNPADVRPIWIMAGVAAVKAQYGSVENYLRDYLDVDIEALRAKYLYDYPVQQP